jgi:hypothetical protein
MYSNVERTRRSWPSGDAITRMPLRHVCTLGGRHTHLQFLPPEARRVLDMRHHPQQVDGAYGVRAGGAGLVFSQADVAMQSRECLCGLVRIGVSGGGLGQRFIPRWRKRDP